MIRNIIWKGLESDTMEFCRISLDEWINVKSCIVGCSDGVPLKVEYEVVLSKGWIISDFTIKAWLSNSEQSLHLRHNGNGKWFNNDKELKQLEGCLDIDISLTPFTNSLPVNRIKPALNHKTKIEVVYIDVLHFGATRECQYYTKLDDNTYRFHNDRDFTADIVLDESNLVVHYPGLFERLLIQD
jgi:hypothetical protein